MFAVIAKFLTQDTLATSTIGLPSGGTLTYHLLAKTNATTARTMNMAGTPNARGKQVFSPMQLAAVNYDYVIMIKTSNSFNFKTLD